MSASPSHPPIAATEQLNVRALQANIPPPPSGNLNRPLSERAADSVTGVFKRLGDFLSDHHIYTGRIVGVLVAFIWIISFLVLIEVSITLNHVRKVENRLCRPDIWLAKACAPEGFNVLDDACNAIQSIQGVCDRVTSLLPSCNGSQPAPP